jgi:hypothetical protein
MNNSTSTIDKLRQKAKWLARNRRDGTPSIPDKDSRSISSLGSYETKSDSTRSHGARREEEERRKYLLQLVHYGDEEALEELMAMKRDG